MTRLLLLSLVLMISQINDKKPFEGSITYRIDVTEDASIEDKNNLPEVVSSYHKDGKMRIDIPIDGMTFTIISNANTDEVAFMMNAQGIKMALKTNKSNLTKEIQHEVNNTHIEHLNYHKNIAGLKCRKAIIHNKEEQSSVFIANGLNAEGFAWLFNKQLDGTLMEFKKTDFDNNSEIHIYATKVQAQSISDSFFELPADHIVISISDLGNLFENGLFN